MLAKVIDKHNNEHIADIYIGLTSPIGLYGVYIPRDGDRITLDQLPRAYARWFARPLACFQGRVNGACLGAG